MEWLVIYLPLLTECRLSEGRNINKMDPDDSCSPHREREEYLTGLGIHFHLLNGWICKPMAPFKLPVTATQAAIA